MSALPDYGVDPSTQEPMEMPQDGQLPPELLEQMGADPNSLPPDPNLQQEPPEAYGPQAPGEYETRERVELCLLLAIESCAKGVEAGLGASNEKFAVSYGQAAASLAQAYGQLTGVEVKEQAPSPSGRE